MDTEATPETQLYRPRHFLSLGRAAVEMYARVLRPTDAEIAAMIQNIRVKRPQWTRGFMAAMVSIPEVTFTSYEKQLQSPSVAHARLIWILYSLVTEYKILLSPVEWATWGKTSTLPPKPINHLHGQARKDARAWLNTQREQHRQTLSQIMAKFSISRESARKLCREAEYCPAYDLSFKANRRVPDRYRAGNKWMTVDWRQSNEELSPQLGVKPIIVERQRGRFRKLSRNELSEYIKKAGVEQEHFKPFFDRFTRHFHAFHRSKRALWKTDRKSVGKYTGMYARHAVLDVIQTHGREPGLVTRDIVQHLKDGGLIYKSGLSQLKRTVYAFAMQWFHDGKIERGEKGGLKTFLRKPSQPGADNPAGSH